MTTGFDLLPVLFTRAKLHLKTYPTCVEGVINTNIIRNMHTHGGVGWKCGRIINYDKYDK